MKNTYLVFILFFLFLAGIFYLFYHSNTDDWPLIILLLILSLIPFIEARGAIFIGFAMGITDVVVYATCILINIIQIFVYPVVFDRFCHNNFLQSFKEKIKKTLKPLDSGAFIFLIPAPGSGVNTFVASLASYFFRLKGHCKANIAIGIIVRDVATYLFLIGGILVIGFEQFEKILQALLVILPLFYLVKYRKEISNFLGFKRRKKYELKYLLPVFLFLALLFLCLINIEVASLLRLFVSNFFGGTSDGKTLVFLLFLSICFFIKAFFENSRKHMRRTILIGTVSYALLVTIGLLIYLYFLQFGNIPEDLFKDYILFNFKDGDPSHTWMYFNHYHSMKPAALLPFYFFDEHKSSFDFGFVLLDFIPFMVYYVCFFLSIVLFLVVISIVCSFKGAKLYLSLFVSFWLLLPVFDGGIFSWINVIPYSIILGILLLEYTKLNKVLVLVFWSLITIILLSVINVMHITSFAHAMLFISFYLFLDIKKEEFTSAKGWVSYVAVLVILFLVFEAVSFFTIWKAADAVLLSLTLVPEDGYLILYVFNNSTFNYEYAEKIFSFGWGNVIMTHVKAGTRLQDFFANDIIDRRTAEIGYIYFRSPNQQINMNEYYGKIVQIDNCIEQKYSLFFFEKDMFNVTLEVVPTDDPCIQELHVYGMEVYTHQLPLLLFDEFGKRGIHRGIIFID